MIHLAKQALICTLFLSIACADDTAPTGPAWGDQQSMEAISTDAGTRSDASTDEQDPELGYVQSVAWSDMNTAQRFEFMQKKVVPEMNAVFKKANPAAEVSCRTCHGEDAKNVGFEMPNGLMPLDLAEFPLDKSPDPKIAASAAFMKDEVLPAMAALLGREARSSENPAGFGCFGCHARSEQAP